MSVLIKGMAMPQNCMECKFKGFERAKGRGNVCIIDETISLHAVLDGMDVKFVSVGDCPLIPVPDHGDLIDRDALMKHKGSAYDIDGHELYAVGTGTILRMPVVIPAERSEE